MFELKVISHFSAAHSLRNYNGKCENLHGHNWKVEVTLASEVLNELGMVMDFTELKERLEGVIESLDHKCLNDIRPFDKINPTTENISREIYNRLQVDIPESVRVTSVTSYETDSSGATYSEPRE